MNQHITNDDSAVLIKKNHRPRPKKNKQNDIIIKIYDRGHAKNMNVDAHQDYDLHAIYIRRTSLKPWRLLFRSFQYQQLKQAK